MLTYEKSESVVAQSCLDSVTLCNPRDGGLPGSSVHGILKEKKYWSEQPFLSPGDLSDLRIKPRSLELQADSLPSEPQK